MPELPEVETVAGQLNDVLRGRIIAEVQVLREKSFRGREKELVGKKIGKVKRVAKMIVVDFSGWDKLLVVHLKMTGQLIWRPSGGDRDESEKYRGKQVVGGHPSKDWELDLPGKHTRVVILFKDGSRLFFNDLRVFGWVKLMKDGVWKKEIENLPPDVVDRKFSNKYFEGVLGKTRRAVKIVLMDNKIIGGVGNIYANDALNLAKVDPRRPANDLSKEEMKRLYGAVRKVIKKGIKYGGATYSDYKDVRGLGGKYQEHFLVYARDGEKCKNCGGRIEKTKLGGRGTYYCSDCQK